MTTIIPTQGIDPTWFSYSILNPDQVSKNFLQLGSRVYSFKRESMFIYYSICAWTNFLNEGIRLPHNSILMTHSAFIASLSLGICNDDAIEVNEASFRILVGELFEISDSPNDFSFQDSDLPEMCNALLKYSKENFEFELLLNPEETSKLYSFLTMARLSFLNSEGINFKQGDFVRPALVYEKFKELAILTNVQEESKIKKAEQVFLGTTLDVFLRSAWLIYTLAAERFKADPSLPPTFELGVEHLSSDDLKMLGITNSEIDLVLLKLSKAASSYRDDFNAVLLIPTLDWVSVKELWSIYDYPILELDYIKGKRLFAVLDPWKFLRRIITFVAYEIFDYFEKNLVLGNEQAAYKLRGEAFELYMQETFQASGIRKISEILPKGYSGKKCDFIWMGNRATVLFEAKNKLRPNGDHSFIKPSSLISSWDVLVSSIKQATATINACNIESPCALIIVTAENHAEVVTQFVRAAKYWKFLDGSKLDAVAVFTITQFEHMCKNSSPEHCYDAIKLVWDQLDPSDIRSKYHDHDSFVNEEVFRDDSFEHIRAGWEKIIPGFSSRIRVK